MDGFNASVNIIEIPSDGVQLSGTKKAGTWMMTPVGWGFARITNNFATASFENRKSKIKVKIE